MGPARIRIARMGRLPLGLLAAVTLAFALVPGDAAAGCGRLCAVSDDNMLYRVTSYFQFRDPPGQLETAVGFKITNRSSRAHVFAPLPGGFTAITRSGQYVQVQDYVPGRAGCYAPQAIAPGSTHPDPDQYRIGAGQSRTMKLMCMVVPSGEALAKVQFADNDASQNAVVDLPRVPDLVAHPHGPGGHGGARKKGGKHKRPAHHPGSPGTTGGQGGSGPGQKPYWWLPNPCRVTPAKYLFDFAGASPNQWRLSSVGSGELASLDCYYADNFLFASLYVGNIRPVGPGGPVTTQDIPGWPGAVLTISTRAISDPQWFYTVTFQRRFAGHEVYGQLWWQGASCASSEPHAAIVLKPLYDAFGPPAVSVPPRYVLPNQCWESPSHVSVSAPASCPAGAPLPCTATVTASAVVTLRRTHPVAVEARARTIRRRVVVGRATLLIRPGHRVSVDLALNATGRRLVQTFLKLPIRVVVKVRQRHKLVKVVRRTLRLRARRIAVR